MKLLMKAKTTLLEQILLIGIIIIFFFVYYFLNIKAINMLIIPGLITYIAYRLLTEKFISSYSNSIENISEADKEKIKKKSIIKAKKIIYKLGIIIYIFYLEFYLIGLPTLDFIPSPFNNVLFFYIIFLLFFQYLKMKKKPIYEIYIYSFLIIIFFIPIINKLLEIFNKGG